LNEIKFIKEENLKSILIFKNLTQKVNEKLSKLSEEDLN